MAHQKKIRIHAPKNMKEAGHKYVQINEVDFDPKLHTEYTNAAAAPVVAPVVVIPEPEVTPVVAPEVPEVEVDTAQTASTDEGADEAGFGGLEE